MAILVELFGIPRARAGVEKISVLEDHDAATLGEVLDELGRLLPAVAESCLDQSRLRSGFIASIDGHIFSRDTDVVVKKGQSVLVLSADAGG